MHLNKIDDFINQSIDNFYFQYVTEDLLEILKKPNLIKHQKEINDTLTRYIKNLDLKEIKSMVVTENNINKVIEVIKRYLLYDIFLIFAYYYRERKELYVNSLIEFGKNQLNYPLKLNNFFNSENNAIVIKFFDLIKDIIFVLGIDDVKKSILVTTKGQQRYNHAIKFLNDLGQDFVEKYLKIKETNKVIHSLVKTLIFKELYLKQEKVDILKMLEEIEERQSEYTYIEIVLPKSDYLNYQIIENVLTPEEIKTGLASRIYNFLQNYYDQSEYLGSYKPEQYITSLFDHGFLIPIVDDFLCYHKDTEKYEMSQYTETKKKKEDTRIRYVINRIELASDRYSLKNDKNLEKKQEITNLFYQPLSTRKVILMNEIEEIKIINKMKNLGKIAPENLEYYNDLINYRLYPYVNFKDFQKYGVSLSGFQNTFNVLRYTNIEYWQQTKSLPLQLRIGNKDQTLHIVGALIIPSSVSLETSKVNDLHNVEEMNQNSFDGMMTLIKKYINNPQAKFPLTYWIFDPIKDKIKLEKYEQVSEVNFQEHIKINLLQLYKNIIKEIIQFIKRQIIKTQQLTLYHGLKLLQNQENRLLPLKNLHYDEYDRLYQTIFKSTKLSTTNFYDTLEDMMMGIEKDVIKLPIYVEKKTKTYELKVGKKITKEIKDTVLPYQNAICQHLVTWDQIIQLQRYYPTKFQELLYDFIQQYAKEASDGEYICKSCGTQLNLKKYTMELVYNEEKGTFGILNMAVETNIESLPEYEKYNKSITILEKILEKTADIMNVSSFVGPVLPTKVRRKGLIKNLIDIILLHNSMLKRDYKKRNEKSIQTYHLDPNLTIFFVFELENSIFVYSSKETDYYKQIKYNNVLCYLIFLFMNELNDHQIYNLIGHDKICNWNWYEKYGKTYFQNLKLLKNDQGDTVYLDNYPVLCYIIYLISCLFITNKIWYRDVTFDKKKSKKKIIDVNSQKKIIHTLIDLMNSILEINARKKKHYLYDLISTKFYLNLETLYQNKTLLENIKNRSLELLQQKQLTYIHPVKEQKSFGLPIDDPVFKDKMRDFTKEKRSEHLQKYQQYLLHQKDKLKPLTQFSFLTNCPNGNFHRWIPSKKTMICQLCQIVMDNAKDQGSEELQQNIFYQSLIKNSQIYCEEKTTADCQYINKKSVDKYLINRQTIFVQFNERLQEQRQLEQKQFKTKQEKWVNIIKALNLEYQKSQEKYDHISEMLIAQMENAIGKNINLNNKNVYLRDNVYIINYDHLGNKLYEPVIILESSKIIKYRENHPFYQTDVLWYTNKKTGHIDIFYDANTHNYLGYKEENKDFIIVHPKQHKLTIKINPCVQDKLKYLGYTNKNIKLKKIIENYGLTLPSPNILSQIVNEICRERLWKLKKIITEIGITISEMRLPYEPHKIFPIYKTSQSETIDTVTQKELETFKPIRSEQLPIEKKYFKSYEAKKEEVPILEKILEKHKKIIETMVVEKDQLKFFHHQKVLMNNLERTYLNIENTHLKELNLNEDYLHVEKLNKLDHTNELMLFYFIHHFILLLKLNDNKFSKVAIINMLFDIIDFYYFTFNQDDKDDIFEIKQFDYILRGKFYAFDYERDMVGSEQTYGDIEEGKLEEELKDPEYLEDRESEKELFDAIDVESSSGAINYEQESRDFEQLNKYQD